MSKTSRLSQLHGVLRKSGIWRVSRVSDGESLQRARCIKKGLAAHALLRYFATSLLRADASLLDGEVNELLLFEEAFPEVVALALGDDELD